ncbi:MAG: hypothetical protein LBT32_02295 [Peptococcaceae bacterium]|nr:hypothetical protein [Peptococcaceae bacterium]
MEKQEYAYRLRFLCIPGLVFSALYPALLTLLHHVLRFPVWEIRVFCVVYAVTVLCIVGFCLYASGKGICIDMRRIIFRSWLGQQAIRPKSVRRVTYFRDQKRGRVICLSTRERDYYISEVYTRFPELAKQVEVFLAVNHIAANRS